MDNYDYEAFLDHITPLMILLVDYVLNRIPFNYRHFPISMILGGAYFIVNLSYTLATGTPVYPPINYKDVYTYVWIVVLIVLEGVFYFGLYYLTRWKMRKYD